MDFASPRPSTSSTSTLPTTDGLVLLDKPPGITSFAALGAVKRTLGIRRVGHTGTLDKFASGLLAVCCGRLTRLVSLFMDAPKTYVATIRLGIQTDTLDPEGEVVATGPLPQEATLRATVAGFIGTLQQTPPQYSALKIAGRRASDLARTGQTVPLAPRTVTVHQLELVNYQPPDAVVRLTCSKGFYVRSLARDLGTACGSAAHVVALRRTRVGPLLVENAVVPENFAREDLIPPAAAVSDLPGICVCKVTTPGSQRLRLGQVPLPADFVLPGPDRPGLWAAMDEAGVLVAVLEVNQEGLRYRCVLPV